MKVGIIAPPKLLSTYCITDIQYCLPKLLVENKEYRAFYRSRKRKRDIIILDCRKIGWKREPEDFQVIEDALKILPPSIVIAPSYMFNPGETKNVQEAFAERFAPYKKRIVRCLEATSREDLVDLEDPIAIPSHIYRYIKDLPLGPRTIFIENHTSLDELLSRKGFLVTSLPIRLGLQGRLLSDCKPSPSSLTFCEEEDNYPKITMRNVLDTIGFYEDEL